jgi:CheY-like chemotaxis protein
MVRVLTVDDNAPFLQVAHELMLGTPGFESAGEVGSAAEALAVAEELRPDLVLADVRMPGMDGIEMTRQLLSRPRAPVVVLISAEDPTQLPAASRTCGAADVISKQELGPARLRELWAEYGAPAGGGSQARRRIEE